MLRAGFVCARVNGLNGDSFELLLRTLVDRAIYFGLSRDFWAKLFLIVFFRSGGRSTANVLVKTMAKRLGRRILIFLTIY